MENKKYHTVAIVLLALALAITSIYLIKSRSEISELKSGVVNFNEKAFTLTVCENITTAEAESACINRLVQISKILTTYEEKLKSISIPTQ